MAQNASQDPVRAILRMSAVTGGSTGRGAGRAAIATATAGTRRDPVASVDEGPYGVDAPGAARRVGRAGTPGAASTRPYGPLGIGFVHSARHARWAHGAAERRDGHAPGPRAPPAS